MEKFYALHVVSGRGALRDQMYSCGEPAATPELARQLRGNIIRKKDKGERLAIVEFNKLDADAGRSHSQLVIDLEPTAGALGLIALPLGASK